jgi:iron-sulfur cluster repair protein YtfE (RIC family)
MSRLVEQLKNEHIAICDALSKVKSFGITSEDGRKAMLAAKNGLLAHLRKEDLQLYPVMHKAAQSDNSLKGTLDVFAKDMDVISKNALDFFAKYEKGGSNMEFAKDFGTLIATLNHRIRREENTLYAKFDELG